MSENGDRELIPYDRMKEQVEREVLAFMEKRNLPEEIPPPRFSFEKGTAMVSFALPFLGDSLVMQFIAIAKAPINSWNEELCRHDSPRRRMSSSLRRPSWPARTTN